MEQTPLDVALKALAHPARRDVVGQLVAVEDAVVVTDDDVEAALIHNHLPHLADGGYITYEHDTAGITIGRGENFEPLAALYEAVDGVDMDTGTDMDT